MAKLKLKYVNEYIDRTGKLRRYFRKNGKQLGPLPGDVGSEEFISAYAAYLAEKPAIATKPMHVDSLAKLIIDFYGSRFFTDRKPSTRQLYRYALEPLAKEHGHRSATLMTAEHAEKIINNIGEKRPGMGNLTRAVLRRVMQFAVKEKRRKDNPMLGVEAFRVGKALKACPAKGLTLFGDPNGRPIKRAALSSLMRRAIRQAGLPPRCVSHGLRKAAMRRLAEADGTAKQIAAISGHKTLKEVERYTKAADQKKLARAAIDKLGK